MKTKANQISLRKSNFKLSSKIVVHKAWLRLFATAKAICLSQVGSDSLKIPKLGKDLCYLDRVGA